MHCLESCKLCQLDKHVIFKSSKTSREKGIAISGDYLIIDFNLYLLQRTFPI